MLQVIVGQPVKDGVLVTLHAPQVINNDRWMDLKPRLADYESAAIPLAKKSD
jgi:hypothetical protein